MLIKVRTNMYFYGLQSMDYGKKRSVPEGRNREFSQSLTSRGLPGATRLYSRILPTDKHHIMIMAIPGVIHTLLKNKIGQNGS